MQPRMHMKTKTNVTRGEAAFAEELLEEIMIHFRHPSPHAACLPHFATVRRGTFCLAGQLGHVNAPVSLPCDQSFQHVTVPFAVRAAAACTKWLCAVDAASCSGPRRQ